MSADNVQVLRGAYAAFARQDMPSVLAAFDEDISWSTPDSLPFGGTVRGHAGVMEFFGSLAGQFASLSVEPEEFIDGGDTVVVIARDRSTTHGGTAIETQAAHVWRMGGGRATSFVEFSDAAPVLKALEAGTAAAT
jgi:ketosteroid isomerase-like protein